MGQENSIDLNSLNSAQRSAVECSDGPSLIIAGAGSGKTKVLTYKIAHLLDLGVSPQSILALTFTNKAANEMKVRIADLVGKDKANRLWMGTFHSVFIRFLRRYADKIGYPSSFTIYDASDTKSAIKQCIKELELDEKIYKPSDVASRISLAKNNLTTAKAYMANQVAIQNDMATRRGRICDIYMRYSLKCHQSGVMDFDDVLLNMNILLRDFPQVCEELGGAFKYILVDEYQDTNQAQYLIVKKLSSIHKNITVVGDDSQSIYGFRGARIQNILNFRKDYPAAKEFKLEQNYRSTKTIVDAANSVISKNRNRLPKVCFSDGGQGEKIEVIKGYTEQEEGALVASSISKRIYQDKASYDSFAILYRTNAQSRVIEEMLRKRNLPYKIYAGHSFYERAEVKDVLAYLRLMVNPHDDEAFRRVVNVPARGIGDTTIKGLSTFAQQQGKSLWEGISSSDVEMSGVKAPALAKLRSFTSMIEEVRVNLKSKDAYKIAVEILEISQYVQTLRNENSIESQSRLENVEELLNGVQEFVEQRVSQQSELGDEDYFVSLEEYLENVALISDLEISEDKKDDGNRISLMTIHSSKGLEFPYVYVVGMEENLFPSAGASSESDIEEERRLFYVAMTRAEKTLAISFASSRFKWGQHTSNPPSRFLRDIDPKFLSSPIYSSHYEHDAPRKSLVEKISVKRVANAKPSIGVDPNFTPDPISSLKVGQRVEHSRFGLGTILSMEGAPPDSRAKVLFDRDGEKTLFLKFAKLRIKM